MRVMTVITAKDADLAGEQTMFSSNASWPRPLRPIDQTGHFAREITIDAHWVRALSDMEVFKSAVSYFTGYPPHSLMGVDNRALLYCLVRALKPANVLEIGTYYAGTTEVLARALWENGSGTIHTVDPFGAQRVPEKMASWPQPLQAIATYYSDNSMEFLSQLRSQGAPLDFVLVDGEHDYEFARFDMEMSARLMRPGGLIVMDNVEQSGPFSAVAQFLAEHPDWRELGDGVAAFKPSRPYGDEWQRSSVPGTSVILIQSPSYLVVDSGKFRSWGHQQISATRITGFEVELAPQTGSGTLHVQCILRSFGAEQALQQMMSVVAERVELAGNPHTVRHKLATPLVALSEPGQPIDFCTAEFELFWQPDAGSGSL